MRILDYKRKFRVRPMAAPETMSLDEGGDATDVRDSGVRPRGANRFSTAGSEEEKVLCA